MHVGRTLALGLLTAFALGAGNLSAEAGISLYYQMHASACQEYGSGESGAFNRSEYRVTNSGTAGTKTLLCPLITRGSNNDSGNYQIVTADVYDVHSSGDVTITLLQMSTLGSIIRSDNDSTSGTPGNKELYAEVLYASMATHVVKVTMPQNSGGSYTKLFSLYQQRTD